MSTAEPKSNKATFKRFCDRARLPPICSFTWDTSWRTDGLLSQSGVARPQCGWRRSALVYQVTCATPPTEPATSPLGSCHASRGAPWSARRVGQLWSSGPAVCAGGATCARAAGNEIQHPARPGDPRPRTSSSGVPKWQSWRTRR